MKVICTEIERIISKMIRKPIKKLLHLHTAYNNESFTTVYGIGMFTLMNSHKVLSC